MDHLLHKWTLSAPLRGSALVLAVWFCCASIRAAGATKPASEEHFQELSGGPYCGVYCLYAALRGLNREVVFENLVTEKYIGSESGSSLAELRQGAEDFGAHGQPVDGLTAASLRVAQQPIILHVRQPGFDSPYSHWVLFLGTEDDKARILDPPSQVQLLPFDQVMAITDGTGLVVSQEAPNLWTISAASWMENGAALLAAFLAIWGMTFVASRRRETAGPRRHPLFWTLVAGAARAVALVIVASLAAFAWHLWSGYGRLYDPEALSLVVDRHFHAPLANISLADAEAAANNPGTLFVDARLPRDFEAGHIPGAVNIPISAGWVDRSRLITELPHNRRVIVYCQSESCTWSTEIGSVMAFRGFADVEVYHGGWNEWKKHEIAKHGS